MWLSEFESWCGSVGAITAADLLRLQPVRSFSQWNPQQVLVGKHSFQRAGIGGDGGPEALRLRKRLAHGKSVRHSVRLSFWQSVFCHRKSKSSRESAMCEKMRVKSKKKKGAVLSDNSTSKWIEAFEATRSSSFPKMSNVSWAKCVMKATQTCWCSRV